MHVCFRRNIPTFEEASVRLFNVVDLPLEGCETFLSASNAVSKDETNLSNQPDQWIAWHDGPRLQIGERPREDSTVLRALSQLTRAPPNPEMIFCRIGGAGGEMLQP